MANEKINILVEAQDNASAPLKNVRGSIDQVGASARKTAAQAKGVTDSIGGVGRNAGQAGIQVQQFVGQLQGGVSPMVALSQQAADLGFVLGVPLVGAIVSIGAVVAGTLLPSLMEAKQSFADLRKEAESVGIGLTQLPTKLTEQNLLLLGTKAGEAGTKVQGLQKDLQKLKGDLVIAQTIGDSADEFGDLGTSTEATEAAIAALETELAQANLQLDIANKNVMDFSDALYDQYKRANDAKNAITNYYAGVKEANVSDTDHLASLRKKADALKMQLNPMMALQAERQNLQAMEANGLITTEEYNQALSEATTKYQDMIPSIRAAKQAHEQLKNTMTDTITDGLMGIITGAKSAKDAFKDMARSIIADILRIQIRKQVANIVSNISMPSFAGGGYTGSGARSGGVDGKGGFPAILHPNETVVDHTKGQSAGGTNNVVVNVNMESGQTTAQDGNKLGILIGNVVKAELVRQKRPGGMLAMG